MRPKFVGGSKRSLGFWSLETWDETAGRATYLIPAADSEGDEEGNKGWQARAILVNLGELPVSKLYGAGIQRKGREINIDRKPVWPRPSAHGVKVSS